MKKRKNIIFILPDQMRADFVGCYGATFAQTPHLDALAREGVKYENCISPSPLCVPARASMLTGFNAIHNGVTGNNTWLRPDHEKCGISTWPSQLSCCGYDTIAIGKMHFYPWDAREGFERRIICEDKRHVKINDDYALHLKTKGLHKYQGKDLDGFIKNKGAAFNPFPKEDQADNWITEQTCQVLNEKHEKPFAMMVGFLSPHCPYDPDKDDEAIFENREMPKPYAHTKESDTLLPHVIDVNKRPWNGIDYTNFSEAEKIKVRRHYCGLIHNIDTCVGKIIKSLKDNHLYDDTIIIFTSDHGDFVGDYGMIGKEYFYEPSIHVPLIVRDSDTKTTKNTYNSIVSTTDIHATLKHLAGYHHAETEDSKVLPSLGGFEDTERKIFGAIETGFMVRDNTYKYTQYFNGLIELYNIKEDPHEQQNLAEKASLLPLIRTYQSFLQSKIITSINASNKEKCFHRSESFYERNWLREYPHFIKQN